MKEYTVELEARPKPAVPDWVPTDTFMTQTAVLLTLLEGEGTFLGPVLSASPDGGVRVLGQIKTESASAALSIGRSAYGKAFGDVFGKYDWTVMAVAEFDPDQPVESIPTPV